MPRIKPIEYEVDDRGCHVCTSHSCNSYGYPHAVRMIDGRDTILLFHRLVFQQANGPIPAGMVVRHRCDNRRCINLDHLLLGTQLDNIRDRVERGRSAVGTRNASAKATPELVLAIRRDHAAGGVSYEEIARRCGLSACSVSDIVNRRYWKHV